MFFGMPEPFEVHLIVDGFNVAHAWPDVAGLFGRGVGVVVEALTAQLKEIHDGRLCRVSLVFDGKGREVERLRPFADSTFVQIFSPSSATADAVVEQMVSGASEPGLIFVASRDQFVVDAVEASGATALSPDALGDWLRLCRREAARAIKKRSSGSENAWGNRLPL